MKLRLDDADGPNPKSAEPDAVKTKPDEEPKNQKKQNNHKDNDENGNHRDFDNDTEHDLHNDTDHDADYGDTDTSDDYHNNDADFESGEHEGTSGDENGSARGDEIPIESTGSENDKTSGSLTILPGEEHSQSEIDAARYMAELGNEVVLRPPIGTRAEGGTSDLLVNGVNYDVYTPTTNNPSAIIRAITKKIHKRQVLF